MRILMLHDREVDRGGAGTYLDAMCAALRAQGHEVHLAVGRGTPAARVHVTPGLDRRDAGPSDLGPVLDAVAPDRIHVHNIVNPVALAAAAEAGAEMTIHDHRAFCPARGKLTAGGAVCAEPMSRALCRACFTDDAYFEEMLALTASRLDAVRRMPLTVLSHYMAHELHAVGVPAARITVTPPPAPALPEVPAEGPACVLFAGRLATAKGVWDAAEGWRRSGVTLPLVFAGTGPERGRLEAAGHRVLGWVDRPRMAGLLRGAAALLLPSRWQEPYGLLGPEALSVGTPVVAWESGAVAEWHPGGDLLVPWGDVDALAAALRSACSDSRSLP
jgi:glycosyltransferase involved in cell wall biosynthesis